MMNTPDHNVHNNSLWSSRPSPPPYTASSPPPPYQPPATNTLRSRAVTTQQITTRPTAPLLPPRTYTFERLQSSGACVYTSSCKKGSPSYFLQFVGQRLVLSRGDDDDDDAPTAPEEANDQPERAWSSATNVTGSEVKRLPSPQPQPQPQPQEQQQSNGFNQVSWRSNRAMEDFSGDHYQWKSSWLNDLDCIRIDGVLIAHYTRAKFSLRKMGELEVKVPVSPELLHLLLCGCMMNLKGDTQKR